jgi:(S)-ureidoglycine aminohydrolase
VQKLGFTRSAHRPDHLVHTPDTFVRAPFPGMTAATAIIHVAPAQGAGFAQYTVEMEANGILDWASPQRFFYVLEGKIDVKTDGATRELGPGGYAFLKQPGYRIVASQPARVAVIEKSYVPVWDVPPPQDIFGQEQQVAPQLLMNDPWLEVRTLLPADASLDFAVNTMTFQPGASLPMVEIHMMEHGLMMLEGGGIYRLGDSWYPVTAGDFIWMAPYCPQWFGAIGKTPAKYLIYKDFNRGPLA